MAKIIEATEIVADGGTKAYGVIPKPRVLTSEARDLARIATAPADDLRWYGGFSR